jgi:hypothetical protein
MTRDPIDEYLRKLRRRWWWRRDPARRLAEVEDHLRSAANDLEGRRLPSQQASREAVERFGDPPFGRTPPRTNRRVGAIVATAAIAAAILAVTTPTESHAVVPMTASDQPVAPVMRYLPAGEPSAPGMPIPAGTLIDATAPVPTSATRYIFITYTWNGRQCESGYLASGGSRPPARNLRGTGSSCRPPGARRPAIDLQLQGGSGQPFILSGTAPQAADELAITTALGHTHTFVLPHIALHSDQHRQAVILDLTAQHIRSVVRLVLLSHGHTVASQTQGAA